MDAVREHPTHQHLAAFLWGQLDDAEQGAVESHIADCPSCTKILHEIPDNSLLGRLRGAETPSGEATSSQARDQTIPKDLRDHPKYKIGRCLGAGGMGLVYHAEHRVMERAVALKIIHRDLFRHPLAVERFHQEVKAAARLAHPNIVAAYDAEQAGETHFLVMEFVDGITLSRLIAKRGPLSVAHACNYARQAALGLQHAFENGMVHRDIKPQNLMLTRKGQIKILDFGLARLAGESSEAAALPAGKLKPGITSAGDIMGTPDYMAPEQSMDSRKADIRADIYSLGCTLYFLLTGQTPFTEGSAQTKVFSHRYFQPPAVTELRDDLPAEMASVVKKMMAKDPADRYQTPAEVVKALTPFATKPPAFPLEASASKETERVHTTSKVGAVKPSEPATPHRSDKVIGFLSRCPYCPTRVRLPRKALGVSIRCPQCANFFTAVPEEEGSATPTPHKSDSTKQEAAASAPTFASPKGDSAAKPPPRPAPIVDPTPADGSKTLITLGAAILACAGLVYLFSVNLPFALVAAVLLVAILVVWRISS